MVATDGWGKMGWVISWVGFRGMSKAAALSHLGFRDTGMPDEFNEAPFSLAEIPTGWSIFVVKDVDFVDSGILPKLSSGGPVIACQVDERAMFSCAYCYRQGREQWAVWHDGGNRGDRDLTTLGALPAAFAPIRQRLFSWQDAEDVRRAKMPEIAANPATPEADFAARLMQGFATSMHGRQAGIVAPMDPATMPLDYIFDIPLELAEALTGYRHDRRKFSWGTPRFTVVERVS